MANPDPLSERFEMRASKAWIARIDDWRRQQADLPPRGEAIRRLVDKALETAAATPAKPLVAGVAMSARPKPNDDDVPPKSKAAQIAALRKGR